MADDENIAQELHGHLTQMLRTSLSGGLQMSEVARPAPPPRGRGRTTPGSRGCPPARGAQAGRTGATRTGRPTGSRPPGSGARGRGGTFDGTRDAARAGTPARRVGADGGRGNRAEQVDGDDHRLGPGPRFGPGARGGPGARRRPGAGKHWPGPVEARHERFDPPPPLHPVHLHPPRGRPPAEGTGAVRVASANYAEGRHR